MAVPDKYRYIHFSWGHWYFFPDAMALTLIRLNLVFQDDDSGVEDANNQN